MSAEQITPHTNGLADFVVGPDGILRGEDGASGALGAALPYTGRLARRLGEMVGVGDLQRMESVGSTRLTVRVTWTQAGEGTYRAMVTPEPPRVVPNFTVVGGVDTGTAVKHCASRLASVEGVTWSSVVTVDCRVLAAVGEPQDLEHLAEAGNRMLAILRSLEDQQDGGFIRLGFDKGAVVGASIGRHALIALAPAATDADLLAIVDEIRAILADHDLSSVSGAATTAEETALVAPPEATPAGAPVLRRPPPAGARYRGAVRGR